MADDNLRAAHCTVLYMLRAMILMHLCVPRAVVHGPCAVLACCVPTAVDTVRRHAVAPLPC